MIHIIVDISQQIEWWGNEIRYKFISSHVILTSKYRCNFTTKRNRLTIYKVLVMKLNLAYGSQVWIKRYGTPCVCLSHHVYYRLVYQTIVCYNGKQIRIHTSRRFISVHIWMYTCVRIYDAESLKQASDNNSTTENSI